MFTGIVEEIGKTASVQPDKLVIRAKNVLDSLKIGDSIAVNGVCLTITELNTNSFTIDIMPETVKRTNLGLLNIGDNVNLERAMTMGGRIGGHLVQGHVDNTGRIIKVSREDGAVIYRFEAPPEIMHYIVEKGFIGVDGISLTVIDYDISSFSVSAVDYTLKNTILGEKREGDLVNLEIDIIAKYVEKFNQTDKDIITIEYLREHGFLGS